jgi:HAMP domain-containing protein/two-component sensor histidine kinase/HPt (histidine-containing phosphotransfer) domain-containing protein
MRLGYKIVILLSLSIIVSLAITTCFELSGLSRQFANENRKQHKIILANMGNNLAGALYNIDTQEIVRQLESSFEIGAILSIAVFDDEGHVVAAYHKPDQQKQDVLQIEDASEKSLGFREGYFQKPQIEHATNPLNMIAVAPLENGGGERLITSLWHMGEDQKRFIGHIVLDYSDRLVMTEVKEAAIKKVISALVLATIILLLSFLFLKVGVISRLEGLKNAVGRVTRRDYSQPIVVSGKDEIAELGNAFQAMVQEIASYQQGLEEKVQERTVELRESRDKVKLILDNIEQGIITFGNDLTIEKEFSRFTLTILQDSKGQAARSEDAASHEKLADGNTKNTDDQDLMGCPVMQRVFEGSSLSSDEIAQIQATLIASIDDELFAFEMNNHCLPHEITRTINERQQILDLSWAPIFGEDGKVQKILLSMRDVTQLRILEEESRKNREEMELISEIANAPIDYYHRFVHHAQELLGESKKIVTESNILMNRTEMLRDLFINMHTLKGEARSLGFRRFTSVVHLAEEVCDRLRQNITEAMTHEQLTHSIEETEKILEVYTSTAENKLGRKTEYEAGRRIKFTELESIYMLSKTDTKDMRQDQVAMIFDQINKILAPILFHPCNAVFDEVFAFVPRLARDLKKEQPRIDILGGDDIFFPPRTVSLLHKVFTHLIRNSMDHGLECSEERHAKEKNSAGLLKVELAQDNDQLLISYSDDGRGLQLAKLRALGLEKKLITEEKANSVEHIAQLILSHGVSTTEKTTDISGRGVGMAAVKQIISQAGGKLEIVTGHVSADGEYCPISFIVILPTDHFIKLSSHNFMPFDTKNLTQSS